MRDGRWFPDVILIKFRAFHLVGEFYKFLKNANWESKNKLAKAAQYSSGVTTI